MGGDRGMPIIQEYINFQKSDLRGGGVLDKVDRVTAVEVLKELEKGVEAKGEKCCQ